MGKVIAANASLVLAAGPIAAVLIAATAMFPIAGWCDSDPANVVLPASRDSEAIDLMEVVVVGNTVLDTKTVETVVEPFLGPERTLDDVDSLRQALEDAYRDRGYKTVSVRIPKQVARSGVVHIDVIEGRVGRLNVIGSRYHSLERIEGLAPSLAIGEVPDFDRLQEDLVALNSVPDMRITPALKAGLRPNTVDVDLAVDDGLPLHGTVEVNNRHSRDTAPLRSQIGVSYVNLWQRGHALSLTYQVAPEDTDQSTVVFGSYLIRFADNPLSVLLTYISSDSDISTVGGINVLGKGEMAGLRVFAPLDGGDSWYPTLSFGVDRKAFNNLTALPDAGQGAQSFATPLTYYPFSLGFGVMWREARWLAQSDLTLTYASPQLGSDPVELDDNRYRARGQQFSLRETLSYTQELPLGMQSAVRGSGQVTDQPLISAEQFSAGGADSVRGYLESSALGDQGAFGSVELRSPSPAGWISLWGFRPFSELRMFSFYDDARLKLIEALPDQTRTFRLSSWGAGLRFNIRSSFDGAVVWASPLRNIAGKEPESDRWLFRLAGSF